MKVDVETVDRVLKKVEVVLPEERIAELREEIIREVGKEAKIRGFRPGKVPKAVVASYYKEYIDDEIRRRMVESSMGEALSTADVKPIGEPVIQFMEKEDGRGYTVECEVIPDIDMPQYAGVEVEVEDIQVGDEDVDKRIDGLKEMHVQMIPKGDDAIAEAGNLVFIKYQGYRDGEPLKDVATESYPVQLGGNTLMPEFEAAILGMKVGEEKDVEMTFPEDYPDKDFAAKLTLFKVTVKEVKQKIFPEINDDFAKDLNFDDLAAMREGLKAEIEKEKEVARKRGIAQKIIETMLEGADIPVPRRLLEKRIDMKMEEVKSRYQGAAPGAEEQAMIDKSLRSEISKNEEEKIKVEIVLAKIAGKENIEVTDEDVEKRIKKTAEEAKRPYEEAKRFYQENDYMDGLRSSILQEKTLDLLRDKAVVKVKA
jgi:trigger factor